MTGEACMFSQRFIAGVFAATLYAQTPQTGDAPPRFASASIVLDTSGDNVAGNKSDPVFMRWTSTPMRWLVRMAFSLRSYEIVNWPNAVDSERWNIDARSDGPTTFQEKYAMLQTLLVERFGLQFHREMRDASGYVLIVAKNGPKMEEVKNADPKSTGINLGRGRITGQGAAI